MAASMRTGLPVTVTVCLLSGVAVWTDALSTDMHEQTAGKDHTVSEAISPIRRSIQGACTTTCRRLVYGTCCHHVHGHIGHIVTTTPIVPHRAKGRSPPALWEEVICTAGARDLLPPEKHLHLEQISWHALFTGEGFTKIWKRMGSEAAAPGGSLPIDVLNSTHVHAHVTGCRHVPELTSGGQRLSRYLAALYQERISQFLASLLWS